MLMRSFTRREKVLLLLLVLVAIVGLYFLAVHYPVQNSLAQLADQKEELELRQQVATIRLGQYQAMRAELDEIFAMDKSQLTVMPPYDNIEKLMVQFNSIFEGLEPNLTFPAVTFLEGGVAVRPVQFTFETESYAQARSILTRLTRTGQRCLLDGLSILPLDRAPILSTQEETAKTTNNGTKAAANTAKPAANTAKATANTAKATANAAKAADQTEDRDQSGVEFRPVRVTGTITFYELAPDSAAQSKS